MLQNVTSDAALREDLFKLVGVYHFLKCIVDCITHRYHILEGVYHTGNLEGQEELPTLQGSEVLSENVNGTLVFKGGSATNVANVSQTDNFALNGVVVSPFLNG